MKYTLHGFSQPKLMELGLDYIDALILRYFVDFKDTNQMRREIIDNQPYYWVKYEAIAEEYPILNIKTKDGIYRRLQKLEKAEVLKHITIRKYGTYSYYALGNKYLSLISDTVNTDINPNDSDGEPTELGQKTEGVTDINPSALGWKVGTNNPSTIYPSTINNPSTNNPLKESTDRIVAAWNNLNLNKIISLNNKRLEKLNLLIKEYGEDKILMAIDNIKKSRWLRGENDKQWTITFDWFIDTDNFIKVLEGNYTDKKKGNKNIKNKFNGYDQREYDFEDLEKKLLGWE